MSVKIQELGCPGHFFAARWCRFRRHTQIGDSYRVSTVGDYYPPGARGGESSGPRTQIGAGKDAWLETLVFKTTAMQEFGNDGCGCHEAESFSEIDGRRHATAGEANKWHDKYVAKYAKLLRRG